MESLWSTILSTMPKHAVVLTNANVKLISVWSSIPATAPKSYRGVKCPSKTILTVVNQYKKPLYLVL